MQIGNPIEEKKAADFVIEARKKNLIVFVTDCGAGGFSSAAGEMLSEVGGNLYLEKAPLKESGMKSWEIFLSESQERMVLAVKEESMPQLIEIAQIYETELTEIGDSDESGILKVWHNGDLVCELDNSRLHDAPVRHLSSGYQVPLGIDHDWSEDTLSDDLLSVLGDFAVGSREPIIREYDHEVQGNTLLKPLAGAEGDGSSGRVCGKDRR